MDKTEPAHSDLQTQILTEINSIISDSEVNGKPLEVDPARGRLFELFVSAEAAGCVGDDADPDLSADGICQSLSSQWGLQEAAQASVANQTRLDQDQLGKMRNLWSVMRMWMEWTYAWERWAEFHKEPAASTKSDDGSSESN
ncbi:MAG: hypothetical protein HON04_04735 [Planctomicrobium sp.]|mgnify:CR=1 FL=1|jgi:hypothetical protein|nr:hypothetical protein [Planctomicrobium sp.]